MMTQFYVRILQIKAQPSLQFYKIYQYARNKYFDIYIARSNICFCICALEKLIHFYTKGSIIHICIDEYVP